MVLLCSRSDKGHSTTIWPSTFQAKPGNTGDAAKKTRTGVYDAGVDHLKPQLGG